MKDKINIAELLKDCPTGMELYSPIYGLGILTRVTDRIYVKFPKEHNEKCFKHDGKVSEDGEIMLFPKGKTTWEGFQRPFNDGDIIFTHANCLKVGVGNTWISIFKERRNGGVATYVDYAEDGSDYYSDLDGDKALLCMESDILRQRFATEEEKEKLFKAIEDNGYKWNPETKTLDKLVKPKFKVGDKVSSKYLKNYEIEKMEWEDTNNRVIYKLRGMGWYSADELQPYKEETMNRKYNVEEYLKVWEETEKGLEVVVNDNFELKEDNGRFYIIKKQPQYPKTYEECCKVLLLNPEKAAYSVCGIEYKRHLIVNLQRLIICRDAYWKIAGDWKPYWSIYDHKFCIGTDKDKVIEECVTTGNRILAFPTAEIRDAFYENFKEEIESCKELL